MEFYRVDNDFNKSGMGLRNYNSTPIFVMYKNGVPFYFKNTFFTKKIFEDFLDVTKSLDSLVEQEMLDQAVKDRAESETMLKDLMCFSVTEY